MQRIAALYVLCCFYTWSSIVSALTPSSRFNKRRICYAPKLPLLAHLNGMNEPILIENAEIDSKKEAVKIFGRLAEKYIALDSSGGNCCYSACTDCEYRLPGGGYIMADQSASRPKWIPHYETRKTNNREHVTKWSSSLFVEAPSITKEEFLERLIALEYNPPLGGPYLSASMAAIEDFTTIHKFFDALAEGKEVVTKRKMSIRLKQLSDGEEGMTWQAFERILLS